MSDGKFSLVIIVNSAEALQQLVPACVLTFSRKHVNVFNTLNSVTQALDVMFYPFAALFYERLWQAMSSYDYMGRKFVPNYTIYNQKLFAQNEKACEIYWVLERRFVEVAFQKIRVANASQNWMQKKSTRLCFIAISEPSVRRPVRSFNASENTTSVASRFFENKLFPSVTKNFFCFP